jgi:hypothetical protein
MEEGHPPLTPTTPNRFNSLYLLIARHPRTLAFFVMDEALEVCSKGIPG